MLDNLANDVQNGDMKSLARAISLVENEAEGYEVLMKELNISTESHILGITGPPGAGKSTITDALIAHYIQAGKKVGVLCIDPSSPFNQGAILGDRVRMSQWYTHQEVFIRSLATRGAFGGLNEKIIEVTDLLKAARFDEIIIETVGVGQSEIEIASLADITVVVLVPESGDEIQTMKAGLMEIANVFVVNKADRPEAETYIANLHHMLAPAFTKPGEKIEILKTVATTGEGIEDLYKAIEKRKAGSNHSIDVNILTKKAWNMIQLKKMRGIDRQLLESKISAALKEKKSVNLYTIVEEFTKSG